MLRDDGVGYGRLRGSRFRHPASLYLLHPCSRPAALEHPRSSQLLVNEVPHECIVFDLGYITFAETGKIMIHQNLDDYSKLGLNKSLRVYLTEQYQVNMAYHREQFLGKSR